MRHSKTLLVMTGLGVLTAAALLLPAADNIEQRRARFQKFKALMAAKAAASDKPAAGQAANIQARAIPEKIDPKELEFFEKKIRPVLVSECYECHSTTKKVKGGLALDSRDGIRKGGDSGHAVVPGNLKDSLLIAAIKQVDPDTAMPPKKPKLADSIIADFEQWIQMGAPDPREGDDLKVKKYVDLEEGRKFWAFGKPVQPAIPAVKDSTWPRNDIDRFILAKLEEKELDPSPDAERVTLLRRIYFDLIGLPPSPAQLQAFLADQSPAAVEKVVDQLLASPQFGERWGRHWLDAARYGESTGMERNHLFPYAWRYRDYVIESFNEDKPYDRFIREQIAGDLLPGSDAIERLERTLATGFLAIGPKSLNERNREQFAMDIVDEQIDVTTRAVMAITVSCARCHDHKFDPFLSTDYYALAGIFRSTKVHYGTANTQGNRQPGNLLTLAAAESQSASGEKADRKKLEQVQEKINKIYKAAKSGNKNRIADRRGLAAEYKKLIDEKKRLEQKLGDSVATTGPSVAMGVSEGNPADTAIRIRGEADNRGPVVNRGFPQVFGFAQDLKVDSKQSGRIQLADWLTHPDNPLTARVAVNRIWHNLMGRGIVETLDNFGTTGGRPTHPELLDYLAIRFSGADDWSVKKIVREIVLSRTYQQASAPDDLANAVDPENKLLWRANVRRLDAESIRDAILAASGWLDLIPPHGSMVMQIGDGEVGRRISTERFDVSDKHRSVYLPIVRGAVPGVLSVFDFAEPSLVVGAREVTTVPSQALFMMNNSFVIAQSEALAQRSMKESGDPDAQIRMAYQYALSRSPSDEELRNAAGYLSGARNQLAASGKAKDPAAAAMTSFCQALIASAEFRYLD